MAAVAGPAPDFQDLVRQIDLRVDVGVGLGRQPDHEVQLDVPPAGLERSRQASRMVASSRFLLMTSRMRWLPASGAMVNPTSGPAGPRERGRR